MPFESKVQNAWAHTKKGTEALGGPAKVKEWEAATDYKHLPKRKKHPKPPAPAAPVVRIRHPAQPR
jgi:hypothetical protein